MNNYEFSEKAKKIASDYKTLYILGCFGAPMNNNNKTRYTNNYSYNSQLNRKSKILNSSKDTFGFDCVCFIKGILWGWNGDVNLAYGGAKYSSNGVPDVGADEIMNYCYDVSNNFSNITIGELLHMNGHVGIYIGDGLAVECTPIWKDGVQITAVSGMTSATGYNIRKWEKHGKLKFINYSYNDNDSIINYNLKDLKDIANEVIEGLWGNGYSRKTRLKKAGYNYEEVQSMVNKIIYNQSNSNEEYYPIPDYNGNSIVDALKSIGVDSSYSHRASIAKSNSIYSYVGSAEQNINMLTMLKKGMLKKA